MEQTSIKIYKESHKKLRLFLKGNGLKGVHAISIAIERVIEEKPNFFISKNISKKN